MTHFQQRILTESPPAFSLFTPQPEQCRVWGGFLDLWFFFIDDMDVNWGQRVSKDFSGYLLNVLTGLVLLVLLEESEHPLERELVPLGVQFFQVLLVLEQIECRRTDVGELLIGHGLHGQMDERRKVLEHICESSL
jgi:hypothetical protein